MSIPTRPDSRDSYSIIERLVRSGKNPPTEAFIQQTYDAAAKTMTKIEAIEEGLVNRYELICNLRSNHSKSQLT